MLKGDLHIHTHYSFDSLSKPGDVVSTAIKKGLDFIAVTDHATIRGGVDAVQAAEGKDLQVIVGAEIKTEKDDVIGLFLQKEIKSRKAEPVIDEIHEQGGFVIIPHLFKKEPRFTPRELQKVDAFEINGRMSPLKNEKALQLARQYSKPLVGGSDAHFLWEIGRVINALPEQELLGKSLAKVNVTGNGNSFTALNILLSVFIGKMKRKFSIKV